MGLDEGYRGNRRQHDEEEKEQETPRRQEERCKWRAGLHAGIALRVCAVKRSQGSQEEEECLSSEC
jgi:hypothetical protein